MTDFPTPPGSACNIWRPLTLSLWLLIALTSGRLANAQIPAGKPLIQSWSMAEYQGNSQNWGMVQGDDGLIYVGNNSSLLVFDGASWRNIKTRNDGRIRDLKFDDQGRLWVASPGDFGFFQRNAQGELVYEGVSDLLPEDEQNFAETRHVHLLGNVVYFNTIDRIYRWDGEGFKTFDRWDGPFSITFTMNDRYYVFSKDRLYDLTDLPDSPPEPETRWRWPEGAKGTFFVPYTNGQIVMGTYDDGIYLLSDGPPRRFNNNETLRNAWPYRGLRLSDESVLISTINNGVFRLGADGQLLDWINRDSGLPQNTTTGMVVDHEGGLWLAQDAAIVRTEMLSTVRTYDADLEVSSVQAVLEHEGQLLVGGLFGVGMLVESDGATGQLINLNAPIQEVFDVQSTPEGALVSGHDGVQLMSFDYDALTASSGGALLSHSYAYEMFPSRFRNAYYVELDAGMGVLYNNGAGWEAQDSVAGITERIAPLAEDDDGSIWVGSGNGRFHHLRWEGDQLLLQRTLGLDAGVPDGNAHVFRIGGRLIFGTTQGGYRLSDNGNRLEPDPLFGNNQLGEARDVFRLTEYRPGQVLAVIGGVSDIWHATLEADGSLQWQGQVLKDLTKGVTDFFRTVRGKLWLPRLPDLVALDPADLQPISAVPSPVHVRQMGYTDTGDVLVAGSGASPLTAELPNRTDALRFQYALASYRQPQRNEYRVRLNGLEDQFSPWSLETRRDYTNLPGGTYEFEVQARNVQGQTSSASPLRFSVQKPAYLSTPALLAYTLCGAAMLWLAGWIGQRRRQAALLARQQELETEVQVRTTEVRQQARELEALNQAQSQFFANVSHEFRTPLTLARGPLEELASGRAGELTEEARQHVAMALRNTHTLQGLIGQILDLKRLESGDMPVSIARDNLATLIREGVLTFVNQAEKQQVTLSTENISDPLMADYDPSHFQQIIRNLMSNAMKFSPEGGTISVSLGQRDEQVELIVSDNGPGIASKDMARIFDRYYQGDQTHASQPGTGIGLALIKDLVALHRGEVTVASTPGQGAAFTVSFPSELPDLRQEPRPVVDPELTLPEADGDDVPTILLVDDNQELRDFLSMRLSANYRILQAENGEQGLATAKAEVPDVIVSDVMMPVMNGLEMTSALKQDGETSFIPIILLSAKITKRDTVTGLETGADDYLGKPFDTAELATRVAGLISSRRRLRELAAGVEAQPARSSFMTRAHAVLDEFLGEGSFGTREWAQALHMDRTTLYRQLKKETDMSPEDYLRQERLSRAAALLRARAGNVSQVAMTVGFNSVSYFSRRFKERFGVPPARYGED